MNKLKSHHIGPVTRNSVGITWNANPVPNPKTNSDVKKRKRNKEGARDKNQKVDLGRTPDHGKQDNTDG